MKRYRTELKLEVVQRVLAGEGLWERAIGAGFGPCESRLKTELELQADGAKHPQGRLRTLRLRTPGPRA